MERLFYFVIFGFKVETDVGSNENYVLIWIFEMHFVLRALKIQIWYSSIHFFFCDVLIKDSNGYHDIDPSVLSFLGFAL